MTSKQNPKENSPRLQEFPWPAKMSKEQMKAKSCYNLEAKSIDIQRKCYVQEISISNNGHCDKDSLLKGWIF